MIVATDSVRKPRIGLIATLLSTTQNYRGAGIHTYSDQLLRHLPQLAPSLQMMAYTGDPDFLPPPGVGLHRIRSSAPGPYARILWEQAALPFIARRDQIALLHGLAYALPVVGFSTSGIVTVHDLSFLLFPQSFPAGNRLYLSKITAWSCRRARRVIAVSEATKTDLQQLLAIPPEKITVVYNGVDRHHRPLPRVAVERYRAREQWPERFILTVGTLEPRKNHVTLLEAYAQYRTMSAQPLPLLIGGGKGWGYDAIFSCVERLDLGAYVHFLGFVPNTALPWLYNAAALFVYPSRYEGFGLPVAEAMACGLPAITSTVSSLPEVAGDAALTVDPMNVEALAHAMAELLAQPDRLETMRAAGLQQSKRFDWRTTAADTAAVYTQVLELAA